VDSGNGKRKHRITLCEEFAVDAMDLLYDRIQMMMMMMMMTTMTVVVVVVIMMMMIMKEQGWGIYTFPLNQLDEGIIKKQNIKI
jgi:hypothetical protein